MLKSPMTVIFKSFFIFLLLNFYSFEFDRRRFYVFIHLGHCRETSALRACFLIFYIGKYIGKAEFSKYPTIFADAPFRETLSDFHSVKSTDFVLKSSFKQ